MHITAKSIKMHTMSLGLLRNLIATFPPSNDEQKASNKRIENVEQMLLMMLRSTASEIVIKLYNWERQAHNCKFSLSDIYAKWEAMEVEWHFRWFAFCWIYFLFVIFGDYLEQHNDADVSYWLELYGGLQFNVKERKFKFEIARWRFESLN